MFILIVVLVFLGPAASVGCTKQGYTALSFGHTIEDFVQFHPGDMSPFASSFTLCAWMKRLHNAREPMVLSYYPGEILMGSNGYFNYINNNIRLMGRFPEANVWFHHCLSWAAGGTHTVYIDGVELGSREASSGNLRLGGSICLGNRVHRSKKSFYTFGGELFKLNMFSEQLTSSQIREMYNVGMCSAVEEKYETRQLKWEEILTKEKHGNVRDLDLTTTVCRSHVIISDLETRLKETEARLHETETECNRAKEVLAALTKIRTLLNEPQTGLQGED